ncbi:MAG: TonB-dependent receptor [Sphingobacteriia bacterium]|nr:TonB-dependent receptor [Sphingobacteriia bacterium]
MKYSFTLVLLMISLITKAQSPLDTRLDDLYFGNLHQVLSLIEKQKQVKFDYDIARIEAIDVNERPMNEKLGSMMKRLCEANKLKFYVDKDNVIHLIDRWESQDNAVALNQKTYHGEPTRRNFSLSGKVVDVTSQEPLPFVSLSIRGTKLGSATNVDGFFTIHHVPADTCAVDVSYIGYKRQLLYLTPEMKLSSLKIDLMPDMVELQAVTIQGEKQELLEANNQAGLLKLSPRRLANLPNLGEKDILRSFQLMPGISAANENSSGLYVRGGTPDQALVQYDGFTVYNVEHLFGFFSAFNSNSIKDVQLYKSGFDARFGGRLSSVVEITGKEGDRKEFNMAADLSLMSANAFIEFPVGEKFSSIVAFRRSWQSPLYNKIFDQFTSESSEPEKSVTNSRFQRGGSTDISSYFYDLNTKLTWHPNASDAYAFSFYKGNDNLDNSVSPMGGGGGGGPMGGGFSNFSMENNDLTSWGNTGASLKWSHHYNSSLYSNMLLSYSNYYSQRDRTSSGSYTNEDDETISIRRGVIEENNLKDFSLKADFEYNLTSWFRFDFGAQGTFNDIDYTYKQNDTLTVIDRSSSGATLCGYIQSNIILDSARLRVTPGLRYNLFTPTSGHYFEPRINSSYQILPWLKLKASAGKYYQFARRVIREDILQGSRDFWVLSDNDKLPVSSSDQLAVGFSLENKDLLFDAEVYYKKLYNITEYSLRYTFNPKEVDYEESFYTGNGEVRGIDLLLQKKSGKFNGWIGYTLGQVVSRYPDFGDYDFYASNDVTHEFKIVGSYQWKNWVFGATWIYTTGRPYTAPEGGYQLTLLDGTTVDFINVSVKNGMRLPDYHRLDLSATYNFKISNTVPVSVGMSLFNVYNRANVWYKEYEIIENQIIETPVYFLGFTPNINLTIKMK